MGTHLKTLSCGLVFAIAALAAGCDGGDDGTGSPTPAPGGGDGGGGSGAVAATITITGSGASPRNVTVSAGSRVTFVNNSNRSHEMASDPHPVHTDCPELNLVGFLSAGQSRATGTLNTRRVCGFHDHQLPDDGSLQGTITVQ